MSLGVCFCGRVADCGLVGGRMRLKVYWDAGFHPVADEQGRYTKMLVSEC